MNRRQFPVAVSGLATASGAWADTVANETAAPVISTNTYPWRTFAQQDRQPHVPHSDPLLAQIAATGIVGYEPIIDTVDELVGLDQRLNRHGLVMPTAYVNSVLHDADQVDRNIDRVVQVGNAIVSLGTTILVTNPAPIRWGGSEDKTDDQLKTQAAALDRLGQQLRSIGITLAYHNHDAELRQGGREFHHMLAATDPANVQFCLDSHWIYRGCGNSELAVFDAIKNYGDRIVELHLRQSSGGIWQETFTLDGDIDYERLFRVLADKGIRPALVLEQAVETGTPRQLDVVAAHRISKSNVSW